MKTSLQTGVATTRSIAIDESRTIGFMGEEGRVYATPSLLRDIEETARELLLEHLDPGEDSVGTSVDLRHLAATPEGMEVVLEVSVAAVEGRKVVLDISGRDVLDPVCEARHERFVVDTAKTLERLKAKRAKAAAAG